MDRPRKTEDQDPRELSELPRRREGDFKECYAHHVTSQLTNVDIRITFCEANLTALGDDGKPAPYMKERCSVTMTPETARGVAEFIQRQVDKWDAKFNPDRTPIGRK